MKYLKTYETVHAQYIPLYHYTNNEALMDILSVGYIKGFVGSIYDDDDGETISATTDGEYHKKGHDIESECRIVFDLSMVEKQFRVFDDVDYGYVNNRIHDLIQQGYSKEDAKELADEHQKVIMTDKIPLSYIKEINFLIKPNDDIIRKLESKHIKWLLIK